MYERMRPGIQNLMNLIVVGGHRRKQMSQTTKSSSQRIQQQGFSSIATEAVRLNLKGAVDLPVGAAFGTAFFSLPPSVAVSAILTATCTIGGTDLFVANNEKPFKSFP